METGLKVEGRSWFEPLVRTTEVAAFKLAFMLVHDRGVAEDIVQEAYLKVWASTRTPRTEPEFQRWLYRTISNLAIDHHRRRRRWGQLQLRFGTSPDPLTEVERRAGDVQLAGALRTLSVRERQAIYLRYFEGQSFADAARTLSTQEANARLIVHRALKKLRRNLDASMTVNELGA